MGSTTLIAAVFMVAFVIAYTEAGNCPLPSKVYSCSPKCKQDYDCGNGRVCCPNSCNDRSCSENAPLGTGAGGSSKYGGGGGRGVDCNNVRCQPYEVCKMDPKTKMKKCSRA